MPKGQRKYNWEALKLEWLKTEMSPSAFAESKGIDSAFFFGL